METRKKYRVYLYVGRGCSGCNKEDNWEYLTATYDPEAIKKKYKKYELKFERAILR